MLIILPLFGTDKIGSPSSALVPPAVIVSALLLVVAVYKSHTNERLAAGNAAHPARSLLFAVAQTAIAVPAIMGLVWISMILLNAAADP